MGCGAHCEDVDADAFGSVLGSALHEAKELVNAAVDATIRQQADEVHCFV